MEFAKTNFLVSVIENEYNKIHISLVIMSRIQGKTVFDLDNYFSFNYIPPFHWGILNVSPNQKCIFCFDGHHDEEHDKYEEGSEVFDHSCERSHYYRIQRLWMVDEEYW